jgi:hypothetical protein
MLSLRKTKSLSLVLSTFLIISCSNSTNSQTSSNPSPSASLDEATFEFKHECNEDPFLTGEMKQYEKDLKQIIPCLPTLRYLVKELPTETPKTQQTPKEELLPFERCDLKRFNADWIAAEKDGVHLFPDLVIQIIPFQTPDFPATGDPVKELSTYWKFMETSLDNMTDVESNYEVRIANKYFKIDKELISYNLGNQIGDDFETRVNIANDILAIADPEINFEGVHRLVFVGPPGTSSRSLQNWIGGQMQLKTQEGNNHGGLSISGHPTTIRAGSTDIRGPMGTIHELMHFVSATLFDHDEGLTGGFGNMSGAFNDFLAWDKLVAKFIDGEQVRCAPTDKTSIHWIKPSTINGKHEKLLMLPISDHEAIAVESIRRSGFNFKLPSYKIGALVYTINTKEMDVKMNGMEGIEVVSNPKKSYTKMPLLTGEFLDVNGYKITVLESGEFGDVVQVEPAV